MGRNKRLLTAERMRTEARQNVQLPGQAAKPEDAGKLEHPDYQAMMRGRRDANRARRRVRRSSRQRSRRG